MHRSLHWKRLLVLVSVLVIVSGCLFALNRVQARRQSSIVKGVAENATSAIDGDPERRATAIEHWMTYLKFESNDQDAYLKYARLLLDQHKADPTPKNAFTAIVGVETFLRKFPNHQAERREVIDLYIKVGKLPNARDHINVLFNSPVGDFKNDVDLLEMASLCEQLSGELPTAIKYLEDAIQTDKAPVRIYEKILNLLNKNKADGLRESKIANHIGTLKEKERFSNNLEARIVVARFELERREFQNAKSDIDYARTRIPGGDNNADVLFAAAEWEISGIHKSADMKPKLAAARALLEKALASNPKSVQAGLFLAEILAMLGERTLAINTLRETAKAYGPINDQYWYLIDYLIDLQEQELSTSLVERASAGGIKNARLTYYRGRLALLNSEWQQARKLLEESAPDLIRFPDHHKRAMVGLGRVYGVLQNPDQQLICYRHALRDDGAYLPALTGEADALYKLGHLEEAITCYQTLVTAFQKVELRPTLARLRFLEIIRKPIENRHWEKFDSNDTLGPPSERTGEIQIIHAQALAARGDKGNAIKILREVLKDKDTGSSSAAWVALARIQESGKPEAALLVLEDAQKQIGDTVDLRLARADALVYRAKPPTTTELNNFVTGVEKFSKADQFRLYFGLGQAAINAISRLTEEGEKKSMQDAAIHFLRMAADAEPRDLYCRTVLIDVALSTERKEVIDSCIDEIAKLEGPDGPISTLSRVCIRLNDVKKIQDAKAQSEVRKELREQTKKVQQMRPGWSRVYVALGRLDELEGLNDQAVEHYRQAINEGDRDVTVIRKTVALYLEKKQEAMAAGLLDELTTKMILPEDLERFRAIYEMHSRVIPRGERPTIERIAPATSLDSRILLLRGSLMSAIRDNEESLKAFRRAIELAEDNPETWESLIRQLVRTGNVDGANKAMLEAERKLLALPAKNNVAQATLLIALGECQELCGNMTVAGERYRKALELAPKELSPNRRMVEFLLRIGQQSKADKMLYELTEDSSQDLARWSRRYLAKFSLMSRPDAYYQRNAALALIAKNLAVSPNDPEDIKAQAVINTVDPATREEGVRVLKDYWTKGELTPDESFHLGMLVYSLGPSKIAESVKYFERAAKPSPEVTTEHIAGLIRIYSAWERLDLAEATLERLKAVAPFGWETAREETRLLIKKSRHATLRGDRDEGKKLSDRALDLIVKFKGYDSADMIRTKSGPLLVELGFYTDAEVLYRKLIKDSNSPTAHTPLALLYIQTKKTTEAIKLAREYEARSPILLTAQILSGSVRVKRPGAAIENEVKAWLDDKIAKHAGKPELAGLLGARAELYDAQENYKEAIAEYRRSIKEGPSDLTVNNLVMLLTLTEPGQVDEAIQLITKVIEIRGPVPTYLDTRAVAYIVKGGEENTERAVQDLTMAQLQQFRAVYAYHLAWAYDLQQKRGHRDRLLDEARKIGIEAEDLHPRERDKFRDLFARYAK
jgi:tetratricopeptide (TPR) repeat protein